MVLIGGKVMDIFLNLILGSSWYNLFITVIIFIIIATAIRFYFPLLFKSEYDTKKLVYTAIFIFLLTLAATNMPTNSSLINKEYLNIIKTALSVIVSLAPIYWSLSQCKEYWKKMMNEKDEDGNYTNSIYPTLMVTQGTFYTFVGVASILFSYNTSGEQDISVIIGGLKLAFITSIIGMAYSIAAKNYLKNAAKEYIKEKKNKDSIPKILDESDFYKIAVDIKSALNSLDQNILSLNDSNKKIANNTSYLYNITGNMSTIITDVSSIKHLTNKIANLQENLIHDLNEELIKSLNTSNKTLEESFTQLSNQMIESVKDSFTEINTISKIINDRLQAAENILTSINSSLNNVNDSSASLSNTFGEIAARYQTAYNEMNKTISILQSTIDGFKAAKDTFDSIQISLVDYTKTISENDPQKTVDAISNILNTVHTDLSQHSECLKSIFSQSTDIYKTYQDEFLNKLFDSQTKILSNMDDEFNKLHGLYDSAERNLTSSNIALVRKITDTISKYMQNYFEAINNQVAAINKQSESIKEYTAHLNLVATEADTQQQIIRNGHEGIVKEYELLSNDLMQKNSEYNKQMITAQEKYNNMLEMNLSKAITVVSDVFREAREQYIKDIKTINTEINKLSESNKGGDE